MPSTTKRKAVDMLNLCDRADEEIHLVRKEMKQTLTTAANEHKTSLLTLNEFKSNPTERAKGLVFLLGTYVSQQKQKHADLLSSFSKFISPSDIPLFLKNPELNFQTSQSDNFSIHQMSDYSSSDDSAEESD